MTRKTQVEYVVQTSLFSTAPTIGCYVASPSGQTVLLVSRIARVLGAQAKGECVRLYALRLRRAALPPDITVIPWPRERRPAGRPSRAAMPPAPSDKPAIQTRAAKAKIERDRVRRHRIDAADPDNQTRLLNKSAHLSSWRDPADVDVRRRSPKIITGMRATDCLDSLYASGTLTRQQVSAAKRLRRDWEVGTQLTGGSVDWEKAPTSQGAVPVGMSERVMQFLERFTRAKAAMGRLYEIVDCICLQEQSIKDYAARWRINPSSASGRLYSAIEALQDWYDSIDEPVQQQRHTIGAQLGEQTAPPAAARWAAD